MRKHGYVKKEGGPQFLSLTCYCIRVNGPPPLISGSQIQHLRIYPELLKSCICDPEIRGGGPFTIMQKLQVTSYKERESYNWSEGPPHWFLDHRYSIWGSVQSSSNPVSVIQKIWGGGSNEFPRVLNTNTYQEIFKFCIWNLFFRGGGWSYKEKGPGLVFDPPPPSFSWSPDQDLGLSGQIPPLKGAREVCFKYCPGEFLKKRKVLRRVRYH